MSKYLTTGWEKFSFIVTPEELEAALQNMHLLITSRHVPDNYRETPIFEYIADYSRFYHKLMSGQQLVRGDIGNFTEIGIAQVLDTHSYGRTHTYCGAKYQLADFDEPCAIISHFPLHIYTTSNGNPSLTISASTCQFPEKTVGLELLFPKQIQFACDGYYTPLQTTKDLVPYQDFLIVRDRIKSVTKPLRLFITGKELRPKIRISQNALKDIDQSWLFQSYEIHAVK